MELALAERLVALLFRPQTSTPDHHRPFNAGREEVSPRRRTRVEGLRSCRLALGHATTHALLSIA